MCGQTPGAGPGGQGTASAEKQLSFPRGKPTDTAAAANGAVAPTCVGAGGFGEGARPGIEVAAKRGLKLLLGPAAPGKAGAAGGGKHKGCQCRGAAPGAGRPWLGLRPERCMFVRVHGLGGHGGEPSP